MLARAGTPVTVTIDLEGKRAIVTGAGQGVGLAIAKMLGEAGATVAVNDIRPDVADSAVEELRDAGYAADPLPFDVTDQVQVSSTIGAYGTVDILVNNAGNAGAKAFASLTNIVDSDPADWERYFSVNLFGVMYCTRAALPIDDRVRGRQDRHDRIGRRSLRGCQVRSLCRGKGGSRRLFAFHRTRGGSPCHYGQLRKSGYDRYSDDGPPARSDAGGAGGRSCGSPTLCHPAPRYAW